MLERHSVFLQPSALPQSVPTVAVSQVSRAAHDAFGRGEYGVALRYFEQATRDRPQDVDTWIGLAASADRAGHFAVSAKAYKNVLERAGPVIEYHNNIGFSYLLQGRYADARRALKSATDLDPGNQTAHNNLKLLRQLES